MKSESPNGVRQTRTRPLWKSCVRHADAAPPAVTDLADIAFNDPRPSETKAAPVSRRPPSLLLHALSGFTAFVLSWLTWKPIYVPARLMSGTLLFDAISTDGCLRRHVETPGLSASSSKAVSLVSLIAPSMLPRRHGLRWLLGRHHCRWVWAGRVAAWVGR